MWKYFKASDIDALSQIKKLKAEYPNYLFKDGKRRDQAGIWILRTLDKTPYGDPQESKQYRGNQFYPPAEQPINKQEWLSQFIVQPLLNEYKLTTTLLCGIQLRIVPATLEPRNMIFTFDNEVVEADSPYTDATEYGRLAFKISEEVQRTRNIVVNKDSMVLVKIALAKSYDVPFDIWNWLNVISQQDMYSIISAALGVDPSMLEDELKKNGLNSPVEETMKASG
jgi:hypothetical protein